MKFLKFRLYLKEFLKYNVSGEVFWDALELKLPADEGKQESLRTYINSDNRLRNLVVNTEHVDALAGKKNTRLLEWEPSYAPRVEELEDPLIQKGRYLDKLVDELAKGKKMEKILRAAE